MAARSGTLCSSRNFGVDMTTQKVNPLIDMFKSKVRDMPSIEPAPEPAAPKQFDTTTPASPPENARRFGLGDLPRYGSKLFPILKKIFPHINDRMYGGWLRNIIDDNASLFVCLESGAVLLAQRWNEPMNPRTYVQVVFWCGGEGMEMPLYDEVIRWAANMDASEIRLSGLESEDLVLRLESKVKGREDRVTTILHLTDLA